MPNYDYQCESCGHQFEVFQRMTDAKLVDCPKGDCSGRVRRLLGTGAGLIFKGSGFYQTDYRSSSYREGQKKEEAPKESKKAKDGGSGGSGGCGGGCGCAPGGGQAATA